ncbi:hypothetical protein [Williamsia sp. CHRR-6]|uniref:hypothetical protein n=1 Tax=Williamsia sp. CHRR-6 TaxID=2835871 RepID=UPI001BD9DD05|nr:hypothetical protein [Williamsia sp. CHRR-6]MBT0566207.1 hypothetical protein [Williamsia sp. CHRR-6]
MNRTITRLSSTAVAVAATVGAVLAAAPTATAAPVPVRVDQIPATSLTLNGLVVPSLWLVSIKVTSPARGVIEMSVPTGPERCATTAARTSIRLDYLNTGNGRFGSIEVKPCDNRFIKAPQVARVAIGSGRVVGTINVLPTERIQDEPFFGPGQPSGPGYATFVVP